MGFARYSGLFISGCAGPNLSGQPSRAAFLQAKTDRRWLIKQTLKAGFMTWRHKNAACLSLAKRHSRFGFFAQDQMAV
jgi:hypothetical protein